MKTILFITLIFCASANIGFNPEKVKLVAEYQLEDLRESLVFRSNILLTESVCNKLMANEHYSLNSQELNEERRITTFFLRDLDYPTPTRFLVINLMAGERERRFIETERNALTAVLGNSLTYLQFDELEVLNTGIQALNLGKKISLITQALKPTFELIDSLIDTIVKFINTPGGNNVVIFHCLYGKDRTGFMHTVYKLRGFSNLEDLTGADLRVLT